jgi:sugar phosphate isomerase/epimerase
MKAGWIGYPRENEDFWESLEMYAKIGYRGMEGGEVLLGKGNDAESIQRFHELGLEVLTVSTSIQEVQKSVEPVIERARKLKSGRATIWSGSAMGYWYNEPPSKKDFYAEVETMETAAAALAKENIKLCYHNHNPEFELCYDNVLAADHMMLNSKHLKLELDVGWVNRAGVDPVAVLKRYSDRIGAVHMKDYIARDTEYNGGKTPVNIPVFTALGTGVVDIIGILECLRDLGHEWVIYEQDSLRNLNSLESMALSYLYMKETGLVE